MLKLSGTQNLCLAYAYLLGIGAYPLADWQQFEQVTESWLRRTKVAQFSLTEELDLQICESVDDGKRCSKLYGGGATGIGRYAEEVKAELDAYLGLPALGDRTWVSTLAHAYTKGWTHHQGRFGKIYVDQLVSTEFERRPFDAFDAELAKRGALVADVTFSASEMTVRFAKDNGRYIVTARSERDARMEFVMNNPIP